MKKYYLFAAVAIFCWSTVATVVKLLQGSMTSMQVLFISSFFAGVFLLILNIAGKKLRLLKAYRPADYLKTILSCLPGTLLYYVFYYTGTSKMPASQAFIVNYLWPIMSVIFACILLKEKLTVRKLIAIFLSFIGVIIVIGKDLLAFDMGTLSGAVFCILGAVSYGVFTALNQKFPYEKSLSMMISYFCTFLITGVFMAVTGTLPQPQPIQLLGLVWNGAFAIGVANMMWLMALDAKDTARISNLAYITPFLSLVWTSIFLKETITISAVLGLAVIMLGILIQLVQKKSHHS